jgi:outer membrane lipoprotein-sorting protein
VLLLLKALELAGEKSPVLRADTEFTVYDKMTEDTELRGGWVVYAKDTDELPKRFRISFETLKQGDGPKILNVVDYAFDGQWLIVAKRALKHMDKYQIAGPTEKIDAMKLGKGPFPMPFGQKSDDMLKYFDIKIVAPAGGDPKNTVHLHMDTKPKFAGELAFTSIDEWIDLEQNLPVKIVTTEKTKKVTTVVFTKIRTEDKVDDKLFSIPKPDGWELNVEPLKKGGQ